MSKSHTLEVIASLFRVNGVMVPSNWNTTIYDRVTELLKVDDQNHLELITADVRRTPGFDTVPIALTFKNTASNKVVVIGYLYDSLSLPVLTILSEVQNGSSMFGVLLRTTLVNGVMFVYTVTLHGNKVTLKKLAPIVNSGGRARSYVRTYASVPVSSRFVERFTAEDGYSWITLKDGELSMSVRNGVDIYCVNFGLIA